MEILLQELYVILVLFWIQVLFRRVVLYRVLVLFQVMSLILVTMELLRGKVYRDVQLTMQL